MTTLVILTRIICINKLINTMYNKMYAQLYYNKKIHITYIFISMHVRMSTSMIHYRLFIVTHSMLKLWKTWKSTVILFSSAYEGPVRSQVYQTNSFIDFAYVRTYMHMFIIFLEDNVPYVNITNTVPYHNSFF